MARTPQTSKSASIGFQSAKKTWILISMVLPGAIWLILIRYLPMAGIVLAFKDYKITRLPAEWSNQWFSKGLSLVNNIIQSPWVGFKNFAFLFTTSDSWLMIRNTIGYNSLWILLTLVFSVAFAILLSEITRKLVAKTYQTLMFFPYFLSWVVVSYFIYAFIAPNTGLLVNIRANMVLENIDWYNYSQPWPYILTIASLWKNIGYSCILYLAAITGIDATQYEAARIDGASKWQQVKFITLPHLQTIIIILFIMNVGKILNADFGLFYSVPFDSGALYNTTQVIDTYVYRAFKATGDPGMSSAAGLFQNVIGFILIMTTNAIVAKIDPDSSLF